jgi:hypothetical protein
VWNDHHLRSTNGGGKKRRMGVLHFKGGFRDNEFVKPFFEANDYKKKAKGWNDHRCSLNKQSIAKIKKGSD